MPHWTKEHDSLGTNNHLGILGDLDSLALDNLNVVQAAKDLVLDLELGDHGELGVLLDLEGAVLEGGLAAGSRQVDSNGRAAGGLHGQREDDADSGVLGVGDVGAATKTKGLLVSLQRLIAGIWVVELERVGRLVETVDG